MADPTKYTPSFDFSDYQASNSQSPLPGTQVDIQFEDLKLTTDQTIDALKDIRRSDGKLKNKSVGNDQLSDTLSIGFTLRGNWLAGESYSTGDGVVYGDTFYKANLAHTASNATRPDMDEETWQFLLTFSTIAVTDDSITPAKLASNEEPGFLLKIGAPSIANLTDAISALRGGVVADYDTLAKLATALSAGLAQAEVDAERGSRRNLWVNGSFQISQENGNSLGTGNGYYPADQVALYFTASGAAMSVQRIQVRTLARATDQIEFKTVTAKAVLGASDFVTLTQNIEGAAFADAGFGTAAAIPLVLRAQVRLPTGTYHFHFANSANNRHCAVPFTISAAEDNTEVIKEIVVPRDTAGTWLTATGVIGITCDLVLAAGSSKTGGAASTWSSTAYFAATDQKNILSSPSNVARLADVGLKLDPDATGIFGAYIVGEVDTVYRSERYYQTPQRGNSVGLALTGTGQQTRRGYVALSPPMAKAPAATGSASDGTLSFAVAINGLRVEVGIGDFTTPVTVSSLVANARLTA